MVNRKYEPLARFLAAVPADVAAITLTFAEIEAILGARLPSSAFGTSWWVNTTNWRARSQARAWLNAGWRVGGRERRNAQRTVTFVRQRRG
jgi:hypothetical protein